MSDLSRDSRNQYKQDYKDTKQDMGVCRVLNTANGKFLLDKSTDMRARLNRHRAELQFGKHHNKALQKDWNEFGSSSFQFDYVEVLPHLRDKPDYDPAEDLELLLEMYLDKLQPFAEKGYNKIKA